MSGPCLKATVDTGRKEPDVSGLEAIDILRGIVKQTSAFAGAGFRFPIGFHEALLTEIDRLRFISMTGGVDVDG